MIAFMHRVGFLFLLLLLISFPSVARVEQPVADAVPKLASRASSVPGDLSDLSASNPPGTNVLGELAAPQVQDNGNLRFTAQGEYRGQLKSARDSTLRVAQDNLRECLLKQNPPIHRVPSHDTMYREMLRQELPPQRETVLSDTMYKVTMEFEVSPAQLRSLRTRDRTATGLWILGGFTLLFGVTALFFRVDEWTKGYLTRWLLAAGLAIGLAMVLSLILGL